MLALAQAETDLREPFSRETGAIGAEVVLAFRDEMAETLADTLLRRTMVGMGPTVGLGDDAAAARVAERHLGWDAGRVAREIAAYRAYVERYAPRPLQPA